MRDLVDGDKLCHEAWARAASSLLPDSIASDGWQNGAEWQAAIR